MCFLSKLSRCVRMRLPVSQQMTDRNQARQISYITKKHKKLVCFLVSYTPLAVTETPALVRGHGLALIARTCSRRTRRAARATSNSLRLADAFVGSTVSVPALQGHELAATTLAQRRDGVTTAPEQPRKTSALAGDRWSACEKTLARRRRSRSRSRQHTSAKAQGVI